jgi:hypothetical protein
MTRDPKHLGKDWAGFDFARVLGKPARVALLSEKKWKCEVFAQATGADLFRKPQRIYNQTNVSPLHYSGRNY